MAEALTSYRCERCGETFLRTRDAAAALTEAVEQWGAGLGQDPAEICEECYLAIMKALAARAASEEPS